MFKLGWLWILVSGQFTSFDKKNWNKSKYGDHSLKIIKPLITVMVFYILETIYLDLVRYK